MAGEISHKNNQSVINTLFIIQKSGHCPVILIGRVVNESEGIFFKDAEFHINEKNEKPLSKWANHPSASSSFAVDRQKM